MRYFAVIPVDGELAVFAECAEAFNWSATWDHTRRIADLAAGEEPDAKVLSFEELQATPEGARALEAWIQKDDRGFETVLRREFEQCTREDIELIAARDDDPEARRLLVEGTADELAAYNQSETERSIEADVDAAVKQILDSES